MNHPAAACFLGHLFPAPIPGPDTFWHLKHLLRAEPLYHAGDDFHGLYQVIRGSCKTVSSSRTGIERVLDFHFPGEFMGMDAISEDVYPSTAIALEDSEISVISYSRLSAICTFDSEVKSNLHIAMSRQILRNAEIMTVLGYASVEERVAGFLLDLLRRTAGDADELCLPMKRWEIASFLAMSGETLSREFVKLQRLGTIRANAHSVRILNRHALQLLNGVTDGRLSWTQRGALSGNRPGGKRQPPPSGNDALAAAGGSSTSSSGRRRSTSIRSRSGSTEWTPRATTTSSCSRRH